MDWQKKPKPTNAGYCPKHNRVIKDHENFFGGCLLCMQEQREAAAIAAKSAKTVINILPPEKDK